MNMRKLAILSTCFTLSALAMGCDDGSFGVMGEIIICNPASDPSVCEDSNMKVCAFSQWESVPCPNGCENGACVIPSGAECALTLCANDQTTLNKCENGKLVPESCAENEECLVNACTPKVERKECNPDTIKCSDDKAGTQKCTADGVWGAVVNCEDGATCNPETTQCSTDTPVDTCKDVCNGDKIQKCVDGTLGEAESCGDNQVCSDDGTGAKCVESAPDTNICIDGSAPTCLDKNHSKTCVEGTWTTTACKDTEECNDATGLCAPKPQCQQGQIQCKTTLHIASTADKYVECGNDGKWGTEEKTCATETPVCDKGIIPVACVAECVADSKRCAADGSLQTCLGGTWITPLNACSAQETCSDGKCICNKGTTTCNSNRTGVVTCKDDGSWDTTVTACEYGCNTETGQCHECSGNASQCLDNGDFQICENNKWKTVTNCGSKESCSTDTSAMGCKCTNTAVYIGDTKISNGDTQCDANKANIVECTKKSYNLIYTYNAWEQSMDCGGANKCAERNGAAICSCDSNAWRCDGQSLQKCSNGAWEEDKNCPDSTTCDATKAACICTEGAYQCTDSTIVNGKNRQKCSNGTWVDTDACTGDMTCSNDLGGVCVNAVCTNISLGSTSIAETMCYNNSIMECKDGNYQEKEACGSKICKETPVSAGSLKYKKAECQDADDTSCSFVLINQKRCSADGQAIEVCQSESITSYQYVTEETCAAGSRCKADGSSYTCAVKVCNELEKSCAGDKVVMCVDNAPKEVADCASAGMKCNAGTCVMP